jgi:hypothetical protein
VSGDLWIILVEPGDWRTCHNPTMGNGGLGGRMLIGVILLGSVGIAASGCSSGPSAAAKILCGSVVASPPPDTAVAVSTQTIRAAEGSGFPALVQAAKSWIKALNQHSTMASSIANRQVVTTVNI